MLLLDKQDKTRVSDLLNHMPEGYDKSENLRSRGGNLSLRIEDSYYDCNDLFELKYDEPEFVLL